MVLEEIYKRANYRVLKYDDTPIVLYDSHRSIVPVIWQASSENLIKTPINLVYFDKHADALKPKPRTMNLIKNLLRKKPNLKDILKLADFYLSHQNDDWLRALMELNLISNAVVIGCDYGRSSMEYEYSDHQGNVHWLFNIPFLNGLFGYQGDLSDLAREQELKPLWETLDWEVSKGCFSMGGSPILLDIDLDYFSFKWRSILKAWLPEFFYHEFLEYSHYGSNYWNGQRFVQELIKRAPLITIAREPMHCGGEQETATILREINKILFHGELNI